DGLIAARQPFGHDSGADDGGDKDGGPDALRDKAATDHAAESLDLPMESSCRCSESRSSERSGKLTNREIRLESIRNVSANASRICGSLPVAAAGSGTPQCAVIGLPGQNGHGPPAALSQTVKTKSSGVAAGPLKSSQLFERKPLTSKLSLRRRSNVQGCTCPLGRLPAEKARKFPWPSRFRMASAMIERAELPVQRK